MANDIQHIVLTSLNSFIVVGGVIGNMFIVILIAQKKKLQNITNILVTNLAVASIALSAIVIPFSMAMNLKYWTPSKLICKIIMPIFEHFAGVCVLTHTAISISRYMIVNQSRVIQEIKIRYITLIIALIWSISFVIISVPLTGLLGEFVIINDRTDLNKTTMEESGTCVLSFQRNANNERIYGVMIFSLTYLIPMICTGFSYFKIQRVVADNTKNLKDHMPRDLIVSRKRSSKRLNRTLLTMYFFFGITTLPIQALYFLTAFIKHDVFDHVWGISFTLFYLQVVTNPLVFLYKGAMYRKELYKLSVCLFFPMRMHNSSTKLKESFRVSGGKYFRKTSLNDFKKLLNNKDSSLTRNAYENKSRNYPLNQNPLSPQLNKLDDSNASANNNNFSSLNVYQRQSKDMTTFLNPNLPKYYSPILERSSNCLSTCSSPYNQNQLFSSNASSENQVFPSSETQEENDLVSEEQFSNKLLIFIEKLNSELNNFCYFDNFLDFENDFCKKDSSSCQVTKTLQETIL